jgi:hypothetical protein
MALELQSAELTPLVAQALNKTDLEILEWRVTPLGGGASKLAGISAGVFRVSGTARDHVGASPWSLILKGVHASDAWDAHDPASWNYWKRQPLALQSGLLDDLPGAVSAPGCYAVQEQADDRVWIWLEDVQEAVSTWTMAHYGPTARHFGQFNGAYLCGTPLPRTEPWLSWGRVCPYVAIIQSWLRQLERIAQPSTLEGIFRGNTLARLRRLADCEPLLEAFERLPISFCHLDAFRRNLFLR